MTKTRIIDIGDGDEVHIYDSGEKAVLSSLRFRHHHIKQTGEHARKSWTLLFPPAISTGGASAADEVTE